MYVDLFEMSRDTSGERGWEHFQEKLRCFEPRLTGLELRVGRKGKGEKEEGRRRRREKKHRRR